MNYRAALRGTEASVGVLQLVVGFTHVQLSSLTL